eukprot:4535083-Pleurochrysis_carterae.AAC.1
MPLASIHVNGIQRIHGRTRYNTLVETVPLKQRTPELASRVTIRTGQGNTSELSTIQLIAVGEQTGARGLGTPARWLRAWGASRRQRPCASVDEKPMERSASDAQLRMRRVFMENYACEHKTVARGDGSRYGIAR